MPLWLEDAVERGSERTPWKPLLWGILDEALASGQGRRTEAAGLDADVIPQSMVVAQDPQVIGRVDRHPASSRFLCVDVSPQAFLFRSRSPGVRPRASPGRS